VGIVKGFYRIKTTLLGNYVESDIVISAVDHDCGAVPGTEAAGGVDNEAASEKIFHSACTNTYHF